MKTALLAALMAVALCGCLAMPVVKQPPERERVRQDGLMIGKIEALAQDGDWLVTLGYKVGDIVVANATGDPISHVGIYDRDKKAVIEAEHRGVLSTPVDQFVAKSYRLLIVQPRWANEVSRAKAVATARDRLGRKYDFLGTVGMDRKDRFYCSELAVDIYRPWHTDKEVFPRIIKPGELYLWGTVVYDSRPRHEM